MISVLDGLAQIFGEIVKPLSIEEIISKNKDLERFEVIDIKKHPSRIRIMLSTEPARLLFYPVLGVIIIFVGAYTHSLWYKYNLAESLSNLNTWLAWLGVGIAIGLGIYEIRKKK